MKWNDLPSEACPIARAMSVLGDRWSLMVMRDVMLGLRRFDQIQADLGITRHLLAERLKRLQTAGVVERVKYQDRPARYEYRPTDSGRALAPVLLGLIHWASTHLPSDKAPPYQFVLRDGGVAFDPVLVDRGTGAELTYGSVTLGAGSDGEGTQDPSDPH